MRLGLLGARIDNGGLGIQTHGFYKYLKPQKTLAINISHLNPGRPIDLNRYPDATLVHNGCPSTDIIENFMRDLDVVLTVETPYNWEAYDIARRMGVKTLLQSNYEWFPENPPHKPDLLIPPVNWYINKYNLPVKVLPFPVDRAEIPFRLREKAMKFLYIGGHKDTSYDRNGSECLAKAIPLVKNQDIEFIIRSQDKLDMPADPRVRYLEGEIENYADLYAEGDVFLYPRRYAGQSLALNEAISAGLAIMMTDMKPQNEYLPKELLIPTEKMDSIFIRREIEIATIDPAVLAAKIDEWAMKDITKYSRISDELAQKISWETLLPEYIRTFEELRKQ